MIPILSLGILALTCFGGFYYFFIRRPALKRARREVLRTKPFPLEWLEILERNVPIYRCLPETLQRELQGHIQVFLEEKYFEGCSGVEINDTIRVCIAAQACILLLNRETDYYPTLKSILVYPETYIARETIGKDGLIPLDDESIRLGESWKQGMVVLAWDHVKKGARALHDGQNLVFHEFAHQLDEEDGAANGTPILESRSHYIAWSRILTREFRLLQHASIHHKRSVLDQYGASNPAEFFAVATEAFFEKPMLLRAKHPELYHELQEYYKVNPIEWFGSSG